MQSLLALPQSSLQSELLIRLIKLYQISQGRSSLMLMRQPKQTPAPPLMKAAACLRSEGARAHNKLAHPLGGAAAQVTAPGTWQGVCIKPTRLQLQQRLPPQGPSLHWRTNWAASRATAGEQCQGPEQVPPYMANLGVPRRSTDSIWGSFFTSPTEWPNKARTPSPHTQTHTLTLTALLLPLWIVLLAREARLRLESSPSYCWPSLHLPRRPSAPVGGWLIMLPARSRSEWHPQSPSARRTVHLPTYHSTFKEPSLREGRLPPTSWDQIS